MDVERLDGPGAQAVVAGLAGLIVDAVDGGASLGFPRPLAEADARRWAERVAAEVAGNEAMLFVARNGGGVSGTVQLRFSSYPNGRHRAEVAKLMVHRDARRRGLGRLLVTSAEAAARAGGLRTLVLDTETGSEAERFYASLGWTLAGIVPEYAASPLGGLRTSIYYRLI
jgi:GNAT superfamily N-acetyltransferase